MSLIVISLIMLLAFALGMRLYIGILIAVLAYFLLFGSVPLVIAVQRVVGPTENVSLLAIPFFIMLGTLMSHTGIAERMLRLADLLVGRIRGGMGLANILLSTLMGGISASNLADAAMLSRMMVPEMERQGYDRAFAGAVTAAGSLVTPIIPPGIALIIYALLADVSVGQMFMAGILPGLLCAFLLMLATYVTAVRRGYRPARESWPTARETGSTLLATWPALLLIIAIIGGIRANVFTPTEAGAVAIVIVLIIGFVIYRQMRLADVGAALAETAKSTSSIFLVIMASSALAWIFSLEQAGVGLSQFITSHTDSPFAFLIVVNVVLLIAGMFMEGTALMIVLVPLLMPTVRSLGIDPIHFGIVIIFNLSIGTLTPPVGTVMLLVSNIAKISVAAFTRQALLLYAALFVTLILLTYIPEISLLLTR
ncbi:TRAP transporter large permease [Geminicoccus harenae]|uniref:TRAP transporter large permease n=1 Tax=Geminicoccus harenae TaxID=2498453 RepID=UPI00168C0376|nr:TRAP transporter large permease [Geminicoccus harenae]